MNENNVITQMATFWDEKHKTEDISSLSGCSYEDTVTFLKIEEYIKKGINVLEVGVGLGYVTKRLFNNGINVSAVDISDIALKRVQDYCEETYAARDIDRLPSDYFDLIICNLVVQHVDTGTLLYELKHIIRSLKAEGVLAIQFVSSTTFEDNGINASYNDSISGRLCRTPRYMESVFALYGATCAEVRTAKVNISFLTGNHVFHVTKK